MATIFSHALLAIGLSKTVRPNNREVAKWCVISSVLPDVDVLAFKFGVAYADPLGHRGFTHSIAFAILWALLLSFIAFKPYGNTEKLKLTLIFFFATISHGVLDAMTNGGLGVGFFIPLSNERYFLPWTPIEVSPIGRNFISKNGLITILSELKYIILPGGIVFFLFKYYKKLALKINK